MTYKLSHGMGFLAMVIAAALPQEVTPVVIDDRADVADDVRPHLFLVETLLLLPFPALVLPNLDVVRPVVRKTVVAAHRDPVLVQEGHAAEIDRSIPERQAAGGDVLEGAVLIDEIARVRLHLLGERGQGDSAFIHGSRRDIEQPQYLPFLMRDQHIEVGEVKTLAETGHDGFPVLVVDVPVIEVDEAHPDVAVAALGRMPVGDDPDHSVDIGDTLHLDVVPFVGRGNELHRLRPVHEILRTGPGPSESILMRPGEDIMLPVHEEILDIGRRAHEIDGHGIVELIDGFEGFRNPDEDLVALVVAVRIDDAQTPVREQDYDAVVVVVPPGAS